MVLEDCHGNELMDNDICRLKEEGGYVRISKTPEGKFFYVDIEDELDIYTVNLSNCERLEIIYRH